MDASATCCRRLLEVWTWSTHSVSERSTQRNPQDMITDKVRLLKMAIKRFVEYNKIGSIGSKTMTIIWLCISNTHTLY